MGPVPIDLPPTMLRTSLYTNTFVGNVYVSGNVTAVEIVAQNIYGNLTSNSWTPGNIADLNITGNMTANYFIGNGSQLTGLTASSLPSVANIDINGNVIGAYANVTTVIATSGNVGNVHITGGNIAASGQINTLGNVVGNYFIGNGSQLTDVTAVLPSSIYADIYGNVSGATVATGRITVFGNALVAEKLTANNLQINENMVVNGQINALGNVSAGYFIGNGSQLTGITSFTLPTVANIDIRGNVIGSYANVAQVITSNLTVTSTTLAIGYQAGALVAQSSNAIAIGSNSGSSSQAVWAVAIGRDAGSYQQLDGAVAIGAEAGKVSQAGGSVALGQYAGSENQSTQGIAIGVSAGRNTQGSNTVAIGTDAGRYSQGTNAVAIGLVAGEITQGLYSVAIGANAGQDTQGYESVAIGHSAGFASQSIGSIAIGSSAGVDSTGSYSIAIGASASASNTNSIVLNATGNTLTSVGDNTLTIAPIRGSATAATTMLLYDTVHSEVSYNTSGNIVAPTFFLGNLIGSSANIGNTRFLGGNVVASGQVNVLGNVVAPFFIGNGSQLTGMTVFTLPATANIDIKGNVIGAYANVAEVIAVQGNIGNTRFLGGNVAISGQINVLGNVVAPYFVGNGSQLTGVISSTTSIVNGNSNVTIVNNGNISMGVAGVANVFSLTSNGLTINGNIFDQTGQLYGFAASYMKAVRLSTQTIDHTIANLVYTSLESSFGSDISLDTSTGVFTLAPGKTYRLRGMPGRGTSFSTAANAAVYFYWYNNTTSQVVGSESRMYENNSTVSDSTPGGAAEYIITPAVTTTVSLNIYTSSGTAVVSDTPAGIYAWADIQVIAGQVPYTTAPTANVNVYGNIIGAYANVTTVIAANGNIGNVIMMGGNVAVSGQVNVLGTVVAGNIAVSGQVNVTSNVVAGNIVIPSIGNSVTNYGNYAPVVVDLATNTLRKQPVEMPRFPGDTTYCRTVLEGLMFSYKDQLMVSGLGWTTSLQICGYPQYNPVITPVCFSSTTTPITGFTDFYQNGFNAAALTTDGRVFSWGYQYGSAAGNFVPIQINIPQSVTKISGGLARITDSGTNKTTTPYAALLGNGQLYMWGENQYGTLGRGTTVLDNTPAIPTGLSSANITKVVISTNWPGTVAALASNGRLFSWGYNSIGQCGLGNTATSVNIPCIVPGISNVTDVQFMCGYSGVNTLARDSTSIRVLCANGSSFACGYNAQGELAIGNTNTVTTFVRENSNRSNIAAISTLSNGRDPNHLIIQNDGQVLFSGYKPYIGIPSSANATTSTPLFYNGDGFSSLGFQRNMLSNVGTPITAPKIHCASTPATEANYQWGILDNTGNLYAYGYNSNGNWGNTTTTDIATVQYMNQYFPFKKRAADFVLTGYGSSYGGAVIILTDGTMIGCGKNASGSIPYEPTYSSTVMPIYKYLIGFSPTDIK